MSSLSAAMATPAEKVSPLRLMDWIWRLRGEVPLPAGQTADEALGKLEPLFAHPGTTHARMGDLIAVTKKDQLAQDPLSVVDSGVLHIVPAGEGAVLRYNLMSRALLWCFLAPLLFLGVAQLTIALGKLEKPPTEEKSKKDDKKKDKKSEIQLSPVDKFLGAPAPEKPKDEKDKDKKKKAEEEAPEGFSPTPAYVFAGIFAALYILGRILEAILIRRLFQRTLA